MHPFFIKNFHDKNSQKKSIFKKSSAHWACLVCCCPCLKACSMKLMVANGCNCFLIFLRCMTNWTIMVCLLFVDRLYFPDLIGLTALFTQTSASSISYCNNFVNLCLLVIFFSLNNIFFNSFPLSTIKMKIT